MAKPVKKQRWSRRALGSLALLLLVLGCAFWWLVNYFLQFGLNSLVQSQLAKFNQKFSGTVCLGQVTLDWDGRLLGSDLRLLDERGTEIARVGEVEVRLQPGRLWCCDWTKLATGGQAARAIGNISLRQVKAELVKGADGRINVLGLRMLKKSPPSAINYLKLWECYTGLISLTQGRIILRDDQSAGYCYELDSLGLRVLCQEGDYSRLYLSMEPYGISSSSSSSSSSTSLSSTSSSTSSSSSLSSSSVKDSGLSRAKLKGSDSESEPIIVLKGKIKAGQPIFDVALVARQWQLAPLLGHYLVQQKLLTRSGQLDLRLWAVCSASKWSEIASKIGWGGNVQLGQGSFLVAGTGLPLDRVNISLDVSRGMVVIKQAKARVAGMAAQLEGKAYLPPLARLDLLAVVPQFSLEAVSEALGRKLPVKGKARIELKAEGPLAKLELKGSAVAKKLLVQGQELRNSVLQFRLDGRLLTIEKIAAQACGGEVSGDGFVLLDNLSSPKVMLNVRGHDASLAGLSPVGGYIDTFEVSMAGSAKDPVVYGSSSGISGFTGAGSMVHSLSGNFLYTDRELWLTDGRASTTSGEASMPYGVYDLRNAEVAALVETEGFRIPTVRLKGIGELSGSLRGRLQVLGSTKDINSLVVCGLSQGTELTLDSLKIADLTGSVGLQNTSLFFPEIRGTGAGGEVMASGWIGLTGNPSNLYLSGSNVEIGRFLDVVDYHIPLLLTGRGNVAMNWSSGGRHTNNWVHLLADSPGGFASNPYQAAAYGFAGPEGIGFVGYANGLGLEPIRATEDFSVSGNLIGSVGVWGPLSDVNFAFTGALQDSPLTQLEDNTVYAVGQGSYRDHVTYIDRALLSWKYAQEGRQLAAVGPKVSAQAVPWLGPVLGQRVQYHGELLSPLPELATIAVSGWSHIGKPLDYNVAFNAEGIDIAWLNKQKWLPQAGHLTSLGNVVGGLSNAAGVVFADHGRPRLAKGSWLEAPWLLAGLGQEARVYSTAGQIWTGPNTSSGMGAIHLEPMVISNMPFDDALPMGRDIIDAWPNGLASVTKWAQANAAVNNTGLANNSLEQSVAQTPSGVLALYGSLDGPEAKFELASRGWSMKEVMCFLPPSVKVDRTLLSGQWETDELHVGVNLQEGFLNSLSLDGRVTLKDCFLSFADKRVPIDRIVADVSRTPGRLLLEDLSVHSGMLEFSGCGERDPYGRWKADLWTKDFPLEYLNYWDPSALRLSGSGRAAVHVASDSADLKDLSLYFGFEGADISYRTRPESLYFPEINLGHLEADPEGNGYRAVPERSIRFAQTEKGYLVAIPPNGASLSVFRDIATPDPTLTTLEAGGSIALVPDFKDGVLNWFFGPNGPDFGTAEEPFHIEGRNVHGNIIRAIAGIAPTSRRFTFSAAAKLRGQWYRDHLIAADPEKIRYEANINKIILGQTSEVDQTWSGLTLSRPFNMVYSRNQSEGRLKVDSFELVPSEPHYRNSQGEVLAGSVRGEADILLTRDLSVKHEVDGRMNLEVSNIHTSDLSAILPGNGSLGVISKLVIEASGPFLTPAFNLALDVSEGHLGPVKFESLSGSVKGEMLGAPIRLEAGAQGSKSADPNNLANSRLGGNYLISLGEGCRVNFAAPKGQESTIELSGSLPLTVSRTRRQRRGAKSSSKLALPVPRFSSKRLVPVWQGISISSGGEMELAAKLQDTGLNLVKNLVPGVNGTSGLLKGELRFGGTDESPEVTGALNVVNGRIEHEQAGLLSGLNVSTTFQRIPAEEVVSQLFLPKDLAVSRFKVENFTGLLGNAPFSISGKADVAGFEPVDVALKVQGEDLPLKWGSLFSGMADVDLALNTMPKSDEDGNINQVPLLSGEVNVKSGSLSLGLNSLGGSAGFDWSKLPCDYQVRLSLADDVWVHLLGSRVRAAGELWLVPEPKTKQPVLAGAVDLSRGVLEIPLYDVSFRLRSGRAVFDGSMMPRLEDVSADASVSNYEVTAYIGGTYPDLKIDFVSNPPLAEKEIQRLLALGGFGSYTPAQLAESNTNPGRVPGYGSSSGFASSQVSMGNQGLAMLGRLLASPLTSQIGKLLFLSDFSFDMSPPYGYSIKLAKAIDKNDRLLFTLTRTLKTDTGKDESIYGLEWRFKPTLMVRLGLDQNGNIRPWFQGIWDF